MGHPVRVSRAAASVHRASTSFSIRAGVISIVALGLMLLVSVSPALASKQVVEYFGSESGTGSLGGEFNQPHGVAVNNSGAGPAEKGEIYVVDSGNNRIERFSRDSNGTPSDPSDDLYSFVSAWGAGVDSTKGGDEYQICTVAIECQAGVSSGINGALSTSITPEISERNATGLAIDQDTGEVYVSDAVNYRVNVYEGDGTFLRSFGYGVVASGPDKVKGPSERQQLTIKADGGKFSLSFEGRATGPRGTAWRHINGPILEFTVAKEGKFEVGQGVSGQGIAPGTVITRVEGENVKLSKPATEATTSKTPLFGDTLPADASASEVEAALNALPSIGGVGGSVSVSGGPGDPAGSAPYTIEFGGSLAGEPEPSIEATQGGLTLGSGTGSSSISTLVEGGAFQVCKAASGDICKTGGGGSGPGQPGINVFRQAGGIAVSPPDGNPGTGNVFLADTANHRINTYNLDGSAPASFGASTFKSGYPNGIAIDSRGIVYASNEPGIERYDSENANGQGVGFLAPIAETVRSNDSSLALAVDPDSDGAGPDSDVLYVLREEGGPTLVQQFGPVNAPGLTAPPAKPDEVHGTVGANISTGLGLAFDASDGRLYVTGRALEQGPERTLASGVYVLDNPSPPPTATLDSISDVTASSFTAHATINPNGAPPLSYHFEYSVDGTTWLSTPSVVLGSQKTPQAIADVVRPVGGLEPAQTYHVRLVAKRPLLQPIVPPELTFTSPDSPPLVETTGSPMRTATTARLDSRVDPAGAATNYYFEYGSQGPCDANPCTATEAVAAGSGRESELVSQQVSGLEAGRTYHYRVVAENANANAPVAGEDMTVSTRENDLTLSHGRYAGPVGSDRAWEQVNMPDTGGNPVASLLSFSTDGDRALFRIAGGTPSSETGSLFAVFYSERTSGGWQVKSITPPRSDLHGGDWEQTTATPDLSTVISANTDYTTGEAGVWHLEPSGAPARLFQRNLEQSYKSILGLSANGQTAVAALGGPVDPAHPDVTATNLYDIGSGAPHLISALPNGKGCASGINVEANQFPPATSHWITDDGSRVFFYCSEPSLNALYMRDLASEETVRIGGQPISGEVCGTRFLGTTPGAVFFSTGARLVSQDSACTPSGGGGDVYRYDYASKSLACVTCVIPEGEARVGGEIEVSEDGSTVYFASEARLLPGAPEKGTYRLDVASGNLAYVAPVQLRERAINPDGSVLVFNSKSPALNSIGGQDNDGTTQAYRYDDRDRSLVCISCPADGSATRGDAEIGSEFSENSTMSADGNILAFVTPTALVGADQNTAGPGQDPKEGDDVYEWRGGQLLLVSDGLTNWTATPSQNSAPKVGGVSPDGRDIFFLAAAQYTPDALDAYQRLYDARVGGGFEFPRTPPPCPLEVCQGTPKGTPEEAAPGSSSFAGPGNLKAQHKKKSKKARHKKRHKKHARNHSNSHDGKGSR